MIKKILKKIILKEKADSKSYIKAMRKKGCKIGERVVIYAPQKTLIDMTRPWLVEIGNDVRITEGVKILTHGYDWSVIKGVYGEVLGSSGKVKIGNNVFIGMNSVILKGVNVGSNVIIGANSLVNKNIPDNVVAAGNPCRVIMSLEEYYEKRKKAQIKEATELVKCYRECYGKEPDEIALREHFWLFSNEPSGLPDCWKEVNRLCGNEEYSNEMMKKHSKKFKDMQEFLNNIK
ncbi:acyltransferase [Eubacterium ventriosum]